MPVSEETEIRQQEQEVRHKAIDLLSRREHSRFELIKKLTARGFSAPIINRVLDQLEEKNYLSDERFAEQMAEQRARKGYGRLHVQAKLAQRGVDSSLSRRVIDALEVDWQNLALETLQRKRGYSYSGELDREEAERQRQKQARFLKSRGFSTSQIIYSLDNLSEEADAD